ncbi:MAG: hypothetical protein KDC83_06965 [Flavobacteriales bacterium]|nr:hypothetical protein [Flavobacteriales bacterium]
MWGRFVLLGLMLSYSFAGLTQSSDWQTLIKSPNPNYFDIVNAYNQTYAGKELKPHNGHKQFERWLWNVGPRVQADGSIQSNAQIESASKSYYSKIASRSMAGNWTEVGPWTEENYSRGVGRLTGMAFDPVNAKKFYVGTPAGGVWYTEDDGRTWMKPDDNIANYGISSIVVDPTNASIVYVGTGDADASESDGLGVWKSSDGGKTWVQKNNGMGNLTVGKLVINPSNTQVIHAATEKGLYKTVDGGENWVHKYPGYDMRDLEMKPDDPSVLYASNYTSGIGSLIFVSKDGGETWVRKFVSDGLYPDWRYELSVCKKNPNLLIGVGGVRIVKSENLGDTFTVVTTSGNQLLDRNTRQGWYNAAFEIDPNNPNNMFVGNVQLYHSTDGGVSFLQTRHTHADNHFLAFSPHTNHLYALDDGGIHRSKDGGETFEDLTNFGNSAIYSVAQSPFNPEHTLTGYQDCGSKYYDGYKWTSTYGADGMQPLFDHSDSSNFYTAYQYGRIVRYLKHIGSAQVLPEPDQPLDAGQGDYRGPWVTPYVLDPNDNKTIYMGWDRVWKCSNLHTGKTKNIVWEEASSGDGKQIGGQFIRLKFSQTHSKRLMALVQNSSRNRVELVKTDDITASSPIWTKVSGSSPVGNSNGDFETDPHDSLAIYLVASNQVYETKDGGSNWTTITGTLPSVPIHCIEIDTVTSDLYIGTHAGIFYRGANDTDWTPFSGGLSKNARVRDLDIYYAKDHKNSLLKAATYGRGLWESDLYGSHTSSAIQTNAYITSKKGPFTYEDEFEVEVTFRRHINHRQIDSLSASDFNINNGTIGHIITKGNVYVVAVKADTLGKVRIDLPQGAATDVATNMPTGASEQWSINYISKPVQFGPYGPGGVGDSSTLKLWLKADHIMKNDLGDTIKNDEAKVTEWLDFSGNEFVASQSTDSSKPYFRTAENGINGWPAVEYRPPNRYFMVRDFTPVGENMSVFAVAQSNTDTWTGHSWIANSREENGFLIHNNNNGSTASGNVLDDAKRYLGTPSVEVFNVKEPHVFSLQFNGKMWKNSFYTDNQVSQDYLTRDYTRVGDDTIDIRLGKDFDERYGDGKLGEIIYFTEDAMDAKRLIVSNYLASKYGTPMLEDDLFEYDNEFAMEVAGIGKYSQYDFHTKAKGTGVLMLEGDENQMTNGSFLLWGHDNKAISWAAAETVQSGLKKLERTWRLDVSGGNIGSITLTVNVTDLPPVTEKLAVMIDNSKSFELATTYDLTLSNGVYSAIIPGVAKGDYLTIGQADKFYIGGSETTAGSTFRLIPNPAREGKSTLSFWSENPDQLHISVVDKLGKELISLDRVVAGGANAIDIDLSEFPHGLYLIRASGEHSETCLKLIR